MITIGQPSGKNVLGNTSNHVRDFGLEAFLIKAFVSFEE